MVSRIVSVIVVAVALLALAVLHPQAAWAAPSWPDAPDSWWQESYGISEEQVSTVADGYTDGSFRPSGLVTRAQFTKMAVAGLGIALADPVLATFQDVAPGTTFYSYIEGAHAWGASGLVQGYDTPSGRFFRPGSEITRAQAFSILGRCLSEAEIQSTGAIHGFSNYGSLDMWFSAEGMRFYLGGYEDASSIASEHRAPTAYLIFRDVVLGNNYHLRPNATLTRGQAAALVVRAAQALEDLTGLPAAPEISAVYPASPSNDPTPLIIGRTLPGCLVNVYDSPGGGYPTRVASDTANSAGYFYANIVTPLADGVHLLTATVRNSQGLVSQPSAPITYLLDTVAPTGSIGAPGPGPLNSPTPQVVASASDSTSGVREVEFQYASALDMALWHTISIAVGPTTYEASWGCLLLIDGDYLIRARITDQAGNSFTTGVVSIQVDTTLPTGEIVSPVPGLTDSGAPSFEVIASDVGGSGVREVVFQYARVEVPSAWTTICTELVPSTTPSLYSARWGPLVLTDGDYLLRVVVTDNATNSFVSLPVAISVDAQGS